MKMLICDDDSMTLRALEFQFNKEGFEIIKACDGRDAMKVMNETDDFDVMITDLFMPYISGLELILHARKALQRSFPIVVVTRANIDDNMEQAFEFGADAYVVKPINLEDISTKINNLLNGENGENE